MIEINLIKESDIATLKYKKMAWDVCINHMPYQVIRVPGFAHCIGGKLDWGEGNCFWAYPLNEELSYSNLIEFNGHPGARWGLEYYPTNYIKTKWGETEIRTGRHLAITRNEEIFYDGFMTFHQAISYIKDGVLDEHPLFLNERNYDTKCIGMKIWYRSEPAVITRFIKGQACVIIEPDGIERFSIPPEFANENVYDIENYDHIKADIFSKHIWWFRE